MKFLGIDVGTGGTRAVVVDTDGQVTASATVEHVPFASAQTGGRPLWLWRRCVVSHFWAKKKRGQGSNGTVGLDGNL